MSATTSETVTPTEADDGTLEIERRVLWLATRIVDYANHGRAKDDELKVGGHCASSPRQLARDQLYRSAG